MLTLLQHLPQGRKEHTCIKCKMYSSVFYNENEKNASMIRIVSWIFSCEDGDMDNFQDTTCMFLAP